MSIQTELTRITNAKAAIKTAIEGKGVTVPEATLLDGMAGLIESIEVGGGGGATIPGIVELFTTSGLRYSPKADTIINITFSAWPNYFGVYCIYSQVQSIFIGPAVYSGDMADQVEITGQMQINYVNFKDGIVSMTVYETANYYFISDVEMTIETQ